MIPKAILLDLDDTIIAFDHGVDIDGCWRKVCGIHMREEEARQLELIARIKRQAAWFWSDAERHRVGRLDLDAARTTIVAAVLEEAGLADDGLAGRIARAYGEARDAAVALYDGAVETLLDLRARGIKLALITNGSSRAQRSKIERFGLAPHFDCILIEEEYGTGKPGEAVYLHALERLGVDAGETWMVGDNYEWEIAAPQWLAIKGIWINPKGLDRPGTAVPYKTLASLNELGALLDVVAAESVI
ncbi:HAD family hydrolase [Paenibacillus sp. MWE-103]|uniref:HAD family hydrolase n=1 Tax=Paenibacillus artemisiicola TaxID=1172618 RepID=A0ABS3W5C1_9BACL|nr:HAD family hydrolase [Paenibacillus artemisiicola]MBO7743335.1 HAD family hydrolase [Paenibacillus artemisiicola]